MIKYIRIAGTCCDLVNDGTHASIKTWGPIANRSGVKQIIDISGHSNNIDGMMSDMYYAIDTWRDSYGEYEVIE